jgi:hypothetical protein
LLTREIGDGLALMNKNMTAPTYPRDSSGCSVIYLSAGKPNASIETIIKRLRWYAKNIRSFESTMRVYGRIFKG